MDAEILKQFLALEGMIQGLMEREAKHCDILLSLTKRVEALEENEKKRYE